MKNIKEVYRAKEAAIEVLRANSRGRYHGLPRAAHWGYPEPYTRDLMISAMGILISGDMKLKESLRICLETLAKNQTDRGHIPSLVHRGDDRGASDTTPLFLFASGLYREVTGQRDFLTKAVEKAMKWMEYQSPSDRVIVGQLPTSDWRDEQWVLGYGLFVNSIVYSYLRLFDQHERADKLKKCVGRIFSGKCGNDAAEGLRLRNLPYYACWRYKIFSDSRFDLAGNSWAILSGLIERPRAKKILKWVEQQCQMLRENGELTGELCPNYLPFILPGDPQWNERIAMHNRPGDYHNGGIWPWISGLHVGALVAVGDFKLAERKLSTLTEEVKKAKRSSLEFGFNEWIKAQNGSPCGHDWQSWSAALYIFAAECVESRQTPFFHQMRQERVLTG